MQRPTMAIPNSYMKLASYSEAELNEDTLESERLLFAAANQCSVLPSGYLSEWLCFLFGGASPWKDHMLILSYLLVSQCVFFLAHWLPLFLVLVSLGGAACFRSMGDGRPKLFSPIGPIAIGLKPWHCAL